MTALPTSGGSSEPTRPIVEGLDGTREYFRETLPPPAGVWLVAFLLTGSLGIAYGFYLGAVVGLITALLPTVLVAWWFIATTPVIRVDDLVLRAGRARLPLAFVGDVAVLDRAQARLVRGPRAHPLAYTLIRSWVPTAVVVTVADPQDPHPYWYVSTRRPEALAAALLSARA